MSCNVETTSYADVQWFRFGYDTISRLEAKESDKVIVEERDDFKDDVSSELNVNTSISLSKSEGNLHSIESDPISSFEDL